MALKQANTLAPSNVSATGFALADARHIGGHRVVATLAGLYALQDWQLLNPDETDTELAVGQQWYVKGTGFYRLTNWGNRKSAAGWTRVVDPNNIDTTLFEIVSALPTTGINKNRIYLVQTASSTKQNTYAEFMYTGDTTAAYDESKWEKLGEYKPEVDLTPYAKTADVDSAIETVIKLGREAKEAVGAAGAKADNNAASIATINGKLIPATTSQDGFMSASDKTMLDSLKQDKIDGEIALDKIDLSSEDIQNYAEGKKPVYLKVVHDGFVVGLLEVFSDNLKHQLTEVFTTSFLPKTMTYKGDETSIKSIGALIDDFTEIDTSTHSDGKFFTYHRVYNLNMTEDVGIDKGKWSKWSMCADSGTKVALNVLLNTVNNRVTTGHTALANELSLLMDNETQGYIDVSPLQTAIAAKVETSTYNTKMTAIDTALGTKVDKADIEVMTTDEVDALFK